MSINKCHIPDVTVHPIRITKENPRTIHQRILSHGKLLFSLRKKLREIKPDILHAHYVITHGIISAFAGFHPLIISTWGSDVFIDIKVQRFLVPLIKYALAKADAITATSKMQTAQTEQFSAKGKKVYTIPFGIDLTEFTPGSSPRKDGKITIGIVKNLKKKYGVEYLIKAFKIVNDRFPKTRLLVVGDGPLHSSLEKLVYSLSLSDSTEFVGSVRHSEVTSYLNEMDIFVMPSLSESETFGVAAAEASAMRIPVVASKIGGIPEVIKDGESGYLVPAKNSEALAQALIKLIENPNLRIELGKAGRRLIKRYYDWNENAAQMETLYYDLLKKLTATKVRV
jgi:glycosyltransferase involved in cell wall biosynthesis